MWHIEPAIQDNFIEVTDDLSARREQRGRLERQDRQPATIMRLSTDAALSAGDDDALATLSETAAAALSVSRASVRRLDDDTRQLVCLDLFDVDQLAIERGHTQGQVLDAAAFPEYLSALRSGRTITAGDARAHPATAQLADT